MKTMEIDEFAEEIRERMKGKLRYVKNITVRDVLKNNSIRLKALVFEDTRSNVTPTIYLECFYRRYIGGVSLETITEEIDDMYKTTRIEKPLDFSFIGDWSKVKPMVAYKLINKERNEELLRQLPYKEVLDLAMVFYIILQQGKGTILIHNSHCALWGIDLGELIAAAIENTPKLCPMSVKSMEEMLGEVVGEKVNSAEMAEVREMDILILSNENHTYGAATILYPNIMDFLSEWLKTDFYILPCSIHEVLIVPAKEENEAEKLGEIVKEVNETAVDEEEVLGDAVYCYSREQKKINMVA